MKVALRRGWIIGIACGLSQAALAQPTQPPATPPVQPGSPSTIPEKTPTSPSMTGSGGTLSDKLGETGGVIQPPTGIDPAMSKGAPDAPATMPIIKPPEEKGGPVAK